MPIIPTVGEIERAVGNNARYVGAASHLRTRVAAVSIDSRKELAHSLFLALRGERYDGHAFVREALEKQAVVAMVENSWYNRSKPKTGDFLLVNDTLRALQELGKYVRRRWGGPVVAITGSNGKTTTKEMLAAVLQQDRLTYKTSGNLNNHLGVPLTLTGLSFAEEAAVVELGANHLGEIAALCEIANPNFGLITNVGRAHLEYFGDQAGVVQAKQELFQYLLAHDGVAFLNSDDAYLPAAHPAGLKTVSYGFQQPAQVSARILEIDAEGHVHLQWKKIKIRVGIPGAHNASNALAVIAIASHLDVSASAIKAGLEATAAMAQRMQIIKRAGLTIINDAYNSSPESLTAALALLVKLDLPEGARRLAILGDMLELGPRASDEHRVAGEAINDLPVQAVFAHGPNMKHLVQALDHHIWAVHYDDKQQLAAEVAKSVRRGDLVLIKGSRGMAMETILEQLPETIQ